jgi:hypothetical protein
MQLGVQNNSCSSISSNFYHQQLAWAKLFFLFSFCKMQLAKNLVVASSNFLRLEWAALLKRISFEV